MATTRSLLSERRNPFLLTLAVLIVALLVIIFFTTDTTNRFSSFYFPLPDLKSSDSNPSTPQFQLFLPSAPSPRASSTSFSGDGSSKFGERGQGKGVSGDGKKVAKEFDFRWEICGREKGSEAVDNIPCLDNMKAIKALKSRRRMEHRERHCPKPSPRCLVPLPLGYRIPVPWPKSRDMTLPAIDWGIHARVVLDVGCGVASFGGYLLDKDVITLSFAPKDEHEAQIQFALERGIPAVLSVIGTQQLTFPDNAFDLIHCARCRVHWDGDGGKPLIELNRILRPGGHFVWSATPVYRDDPRDQGVWNAMITLTKSICWRVVVKATDATGIGLVIYQKPTLNSCYDERKVNNPPLCIQKNRSSISWYTPLEDCLPPVHIANSDVQQTWPVWPERLNVWPSNLFELNREYGEERFYEDMKHWEVLVSGIYTFDLAINWSSFRNVMDMNAGFGGFAAALVKEPLWVMNVVPIHGPDTLPFIFDRGLIGIYHDWCESFNTYPRTYDLLHSSFLFGSLTKRCDLVDVVTEMDRILRPGGWILIQDTEEIIKKLNSMLQALHWDTSIHKGAFLVGKKGFWRP